MDYDDQINLALQKAKWCFTPQSLPTIGNGFMLTCLPGVIIRIFDGATGVFGDASGGKSRPQDSPPTSIEDFLSKSACIFSTAFSTHLREKFDAFDEVCGESIVDGFLAVDDCVSWTITITENTLNRYLEDVRKEQGLLRPGLLRLRGVKDFSQFDGTPEGPPPPAPIIQVGTTIAQAWAENKTVGRITGFERLPLYNWTPSSPGGAPVFHGTSAHLRDPESELEMDSVLSANPTLLRRAEGKTSLYPSSNKGICTTFSALRSFLWAAFLAEVIQDPPGPTAGAFLQKPFRIRNQDFKGVVLLMFHSHQPALPGMSWYQVPADQETAWSNAVQREPLSAAANVWTDRLKAIHKQDTPGYPDVIHGRELPGLRSRLRTFPCNNALLWRSAWVSESAALALNSRITEMYAISFEVVRPPAPEPEKKG